MAFHAYQIVSCSMSWKTRHNRPRLAGMICASKVGVDHVMRLVRLRALDIIHRAANELLL
jgi:hypothetical protein